MTSTRQLLTLIQDGHVLMSRERGFLMRGEFALAAGLADEKLRLLAALEEVIPRVRGTESVRAAISGLVADGRRNEQLILSARQGLSQARRRLEAIIATLRGVVAYDRNGDLITSRDDASQKRSKA